MVYDLLITEVIKTLRLKHPLRWSELRDMLYPKFQNQYEKDSFDSMLTHVLQQLIKDGIVVKIERVRGRKKLRKKFLYLLKDELKADALLYGLGADTEEEYLARIFVYLNKLKKKNEEEFRRALAIATVGSKEELILKIKTLNTRWFQHIKNKYFGKAPNHNNPMIFITWWNRIVDDLHNMVWEWRNILWYWAFFVKEYGIPISMWEKIRDIIELLGETTVQLKSFIELAKFTDKIGWIEQAKAAMKHHIQRVIDEEGKRFEKIIRLSNELENMLAEYEPSD